MITVKRAVYGCAPAGLTGQWEGTSGGRTDGERHGLIQAEVEKTTPLIGDVSEYGGSTRGGADENEEVIRF